ncbi:MAG: hypothetical protein IT348_19925 [Candidatus Eisenbacteria bacterium]|nr:hypothetical protein [Candidatus Eisenbacteria bacterium]
MLDLIAASTAPDSDGDGLPDDVEVFLGTKPRDRDSDHDGITDFVEIFGTGAADPVKVIADSNGNRVIAALDADDDGDGVVDGQQRDSDGDGIPDYLEYYGFTYSALTGKYSPWDGDFTKRYYKTDPHQKSTDQDPFDDALEITGVNMDPSVTSPGNLPMVPAYPDIEVRLEGYSVTLNQVLSWSKTASLAQGTTWDRRAETSHSSTTEHNWGTAFSATARLGVNAGKELSVSVNYGGRHESTSGSSNSVSSGGSILSTQTWASASTQNPIDAARIKLYLKVRNKGTAVASNLKPAFTLKIGGRNVATIVPGGTQVNLLEPGGVYPAAPGVYWVVNSNASGEPLSLTLAELRALESGAPVSITLTQMSADVMLRNPATGAYQSAGDWNEYMARVRAVSANLFLDRGDGNTVRAMVYADNSVTSPIVTLGDALVWAGKARQDPATGEVFVSYFDEATSATREASLAGWRFAVDPDTYRANGFSEATPVPAGFDISTLRLLPRSYVVAKAPRAQVPGARSAPSIQSAWLDPITGSVNVVVGDYNGIRSVEFVDRNNQVRVMRQDLPESSFYVYTPAQDTANYPTGYEFNSTERVRVTNVDGQSDDKSFIAQYSAAALQKPTIDSISVDFLNKRIYVRVTSDLPLEFVSIFGESFTGGVCEMQRVLNWFEDPKGWVCEGADLPYPFVGWNFSNIQGSRVVAYAGPDLVAVEAIEEVDVDTHTSGRGRMKAIFVPIFENLWTVGFDEIFDTIDLDTGAVGYITGAYRPSDSVIGPPSDAWIKMGTDAGGPILFFNFSFQSQHLGKQGDPGVDYGSLTRGEIQKKLDATAPSFASRRIQCDSSANVFIYRTADGRYGKLRLMCDTWWRGTDSHHDRVMTGQIASAEYEFATFRPAP